MAYFNVIRVFRFGLDNVIGYGTSSGKIGFCDYNGKKIKGLNEIKAFTTEIKDLRFNISGDKILVIGSDKKDGEFIYHSKVRLLRIDGTLIVEYGSNIQPVKCIFSYDESRVIIGTFGGEVSIFNIDGTLINAFQAIEQEYANDSCIHGFDFSHFENKIITSGRQKAKLWEIDGSLIKVVQQSELTPINSIFSPNGKYIAIDECVGIVNIYDNNGGIYSKITAYSCSGVITDIVFSENSELVLAFNQMSNVCKLFRIDGSNCYNFQTGYDTIKGVFIPNSNSFIAMSLKQIQIINIESGIIFSIKSIK